MTDGRAPILLADDPDRIGHALLRLAPPREGPLTVSIRFLDGSYLGEGGRRSPARHLFAAEPRQPADTYALGPGVTAHIREAEVVALADDDGRPLGTVAWDGIRPPPDRGRGALLGSSDRPAALSRPPSAVAVPIPPEPVALPRPAAEVEVGGEPTGVAPPRRPRRRSRAIGVAALGLALLAAALWPALVLSGRLGWRVEPGALALTPGGAREGTARLVALWPARPFAGLLPPPFVLAAAPDGVTLEQARDGQGWTLRAALAPGELRPGRRSARLPATFPLGGASAGLGVDIALTVPEPLPASPPLPPPPPPPPPPSPSPVDDAVCDRAAGNRLDPDHPAGAGAVDDVFALAPEAVDAGIAACDPAPDRGGPARRLVVQRGRLLAARAVARADRGDAAGARADMDEALRLWHAGSAEGSGFADSLIGSYLFGAFDRPALAFVRPDDAAAVDAWRRGMGRGSLASQRNYAAQLLGGHGVTADPARALALLRDALGRGDEAAAGVLGVALYTGFPAGVARDPDQGWRLMVRAQCLDRPSAALLAAETARGVRPAADRRTCP